MKRVLYEIFICSILQNYDNDSEDESEGSVYSGQTDGSSQPATNSYYHTNAMTIYNDINGRSQYNLVATTANGHVVSGAIQENKPNRQFNTSHEPTAPGQVSTKTSVKQRSPVNKGKPKSGNSLLFLASSGNTAERRENEKKVGSVASITSAGASSAATMAANNNKPNARSKNDAKDRNAPSDDSGFQLTASNHAAHPNSRYLAPANRKPAMYRSSSELRSTGYKKNFGMSDINEEEKKDRSLSRSKSVEGDELMYGLETDMDVINENQKGLWTDTELYTDKENSDSEATETQDYILDTTAYVCSVIDSLGLTKEERESILMVVARDERLRVKEKQRIL